MAGSQRGLPRALALDLAIQTVAGAAEMASFHKRASRSVARNGCEPGQAPRSPASLSSKELRCVRLS